MINVNNTMLNIIDRILNSQEFSAEPIHNLILVYKFNEILKFKMCTHYSIYT